MVEPSFPLEIHYRIVDMLGGCPKALEQISLAAKKFISRARPLLFQEIRVESLKSCVELASLICSPHCTIPSKAKSLYIQFERPHPRNKADYNCETIFDALADAFDYFDALDTSISLNIPWVLSRNLDWTYLRSYTGLRKFVLVGKYNWLHDVTRLLHCTNRLEVLIVDASFKCGSTPPELIGLFDWAESDPPCRLPLTLKELSLTSDSFPLMRWMCSVSETSVGGFSLHTLRIRVDQAYPHQRRSFRDLAPFLEMYGSKLAHLYVWFEQNYNGDSVYEALRDALPHAPNLRNLDLLFPLIQYEEDTWRLTDIVLSRKKSPATSVNIVSGEDISVDEAEYWRTPKPCTAGEAPEECQMACKRLIELGYDGSDN